MDDRPDLPSAPYASQAETMAGDQPSSSSRPRAKDSPEFPLKEWDRYEFLRFLGQGGMGTVFLARDRRLGREVAIKFVRSEDGRYLERFLVEARAQARVNHEHVCKVFEVGEVEGRAFIAMQHLAGAPLDVVPGLSLEQKVIVVRDACLGVHEAHRVGIIHRDLKPANIMVERTEDGSCRTFVMDFGLAREWNQEVTETGSVLGTPAYMSPEQARGEVSALDRRTDVYSLGATLYHVVAGSPPLPGSNPLMVLSAIASMDVAPMRSLRPDVPKDLDAIVLKCLEKERSRRYASAKALADDLDRFLSGDPVEARPTGVFYRLQRRLLKHKQLSAVGAVAGVIVLAALAVTMRTRQEAGRRERLAQQFTESMARIEALARYSALSPLHDIRPDLKAVRAGLTHLEQDMKQAGALANGPGHYALGRGYWTLDEEEKALEHLQMAWDAGYREPRVAYALAVVLGHQYRDRLLEAERRSTAEQREARQQDLTSSLGARAFTFLRLAQGPDEASQAYLEALMASYEGRLDEALVRLKALGDFQPWFYEARLLRGVLLQTRAWKAWNQGQQEAALADFEQGRQELAQAAASARSAPVVHAALAELELNVLIMEKYGQGRVEPAFTRGLNAVQAALAAQPDHPPSLILQAALLGELADFRMNHGERSDEMVQEAVLIAGKAVAAGPTRVDTWAALGKAYYQWGNALQDQNRDPTDPLAKGLRAFESISLEKRDYSVENHLGLIHQTWSDYEEQKGRNPTAHRNSAISAYERATHMEAYQLPAWINLGTCLQQRAMQPKAPNPEDDLLAALKVLDQARALNPKHFVPYFVRGKILLNLAQLRRDRGEDPEPELHRSIAAHRQGLEINAGIPHLHSGVGLAQVHLAHLAWATGRDPLPLLAQAQEAYQRAITVAPNQPLGYLNLGDLLIWRARWEKTPEASRSLQRADSVLQQALTLAPNNKGVLANLGRVEAVRLEISLRDGANPTSVLARGEATLAKVLALDSRHSDSLQYLGELRAAAARWKASHGHAERGDFERARTALGGAQAVAGESQETLLALARLCGDRAEWERTTGQDSAPSLAEGHGWVTRVLKVRPHWGEALALEGRLCLEEAEALPPKARGAKAHESQQAFKKAFALSQNLRGEWQAKADRSQQLLQARP